MIDAYPRTPAGSTRELVALLRALPPAARTAGFGRFPVGGAATWSHDWLFPRHSPSFHVHEGTDVFAVRGTPVLSPAAGTARISRGEVGGLAVKVVQRDGTYWYLAHLAGVTVADGDRVVPGSAVGTVGDSGNAKGGAPHVHVEVHPHGGEPLDPKPLLDQYYDEALGAAPALVASHPARVRRSPDRLDPPPPVIGGEACALPPDAGAIGSLGARGLKGRRGTALSS
jgi:murein DD-endopeptidase MepM/ murein hydrolase activator NlpD